MKLEVGSSAGGPRIARFLHKKSRVKWLLSGSLLAIKKFSAWFLGADFRTGSDEPPSSLSIWL
jgi:hypothetical protein